MVENESGYIGQSQLRAKNATHHDMIQVFHEEPNYFVKYTEKSLKYLRNHHELVTICAIKYLITNANMDFINLTIQIVTNIQNQNMYMIKFSL